MILLVAATSPLWFLAAFAPGTAVIPGAILALLLAAAVWNYLQAPGRRHIAVDRRIPSRFSLDAEQFVALSVTNISRKHVSLEARDDIPDSLSLVSPAATLLLAPGAVSTVRYMVKPIRRGPARFRRVSFRLAHGIGLLSRQFTVPVESLGKVFPGFLRADQYNLLAVADRREEATRIPRHAKGRGSEYEGLRAYAPGDDVRAIDWKTTAKRGFPVSRTYVVDRGQQVTILVDAGRFMAESIAGRTRFEHAVEAAVMLSSVVQRRGDSLSVACFSNRLESFLPAIKGPSIVPRVLDSLCDVRARSVESDYWHVFSRVLARLTRRCLIVLFCEVLDRASSAGLVNSLSRSAARHLVLCVVLVDGRVAAAAAQASPDNHRMYEKAAASHLLRERALALNEMRSRGILVLESEPDAFSVRLIRTYLDIRRTNRL